MKIQKGHYVPKELITSEAVHEAVVKCFVAAGFIDERPEYGCYENIHATGLCASDGGRIIWGGSVSCEKPLTIQQLFTAENGLQWPDWAFDIRHDESLVYFTNGIRKYECIANDLGPRIGGGTVCNLEGTILAIRQPKEKAVKTIEDAVIELDGELPDKHSTRRHNKNGWYILENKTLTHINDPVWFNPKEFEACAKLLGYINGYRWGIEYPTNGKRPELADDVEVSWSSSITGVSGVSRVSRLDWSANADGDECYHVITNFKITDQRYKPADTSYLDASTQTQSLTHSEEGLTHSDWHERGELPPVGVECEVIFPDDTEPKWEHVVILFRSDFLVVASFSGVEYSFETAHLKSKAKFRPIRTEREKVIEAALGPVSIWNLREAKKGLEALYDAGMLVLPPKKSDTED